MPQSALIQFLANGSGVDPQAQSFQSVGVKLSGWHLIPLGLERVFL